MPFLWAFRKLEGNIFLLFSWMFNYSLYFCSKTKNKIKNNMNKISRFFIAMLLLCFPFAQLSAMQQKVIMGGQYNDPDNEDPPFKRSPIAPIYVGQDGYTFTFNASLAGEVVEVLGDDQLLYTTIIGDDGKVVVPDIISGEVELRLYRGSLVYHAIVDL